VLYLALTGKSFLEEISASTLDILELILTFIATIAASSGIWIFLDKRNDRKDKDDKEKQTQNKLLLGLAHDRILYLGGVYIDRHWITQDEFENLHDYLYQPYLDMGGNGAAKRIMEEVQKLPISTTRYVKPECD
jgi:hypothetical protein